MSDKSQNEIVHSRTEEKVSKTPNETIVIEENLISKAYDVDLPAPIPSTSSERPIIYVNDSKSGPKKHACQYCGKLYIKIARHLITVHKNEDDVKKIIALKPQDPSRLELIRKVRCAGDSKHNMNIQPGTKKHELIVLRRPRNYVDKIEKTPQILQFVLVVRFRRAKNFFQLILLLVLVTQGSIVE